MKQHRLAAAVALVGLVLAGCDSQTSVELKTPAQKASYGIGLNMGKSLAQEGMEDLDSKAVALGIEDAVGKKEQRIKDEELVEAFTALQKRAESIKQEIQQSQMSLEEQLKAAQQKASIEATKATVAPSPAVAPVWLSAAQPAADTQRRIQALEKLSSEELGSYGSDTSKRMTALSESVTSRVTLANSGDFSDGIVQILKLTGAVDIKQLGQPSEKGLSGLIRKAKNAVTGVKVDRKSVV